MPQGRLKAGSAGLEQFVQATARCGWILQRVGLYADRADVSLRQTFRPAVYAFVRQTCGLFAPHGWFGG
ncbi:hypothetical protein HMPREF3107_05380 [Neisseria sp. HMSC31F04]|nr:hypothetical protein HMPREF3107_05380 [Neisseria sp. HMSC31F04]